MERVVIPILKFLAPIFFDPKYLKGKYFEKSHTGWIWVWRSIWFQKILGFNRAVPWPVSPFIVISNPKNIFFDPGDINNFQGYGNYFQNFAGRIYIGKGTYIAPNVGIITANHNPYNLDEHLPGEDVIIGKNCWIGMNSVILPGVVLGDRTIVGAGSVVTKSFPDGNCIIAGNPAKIIKLLDKKSS
ncbi:MAG: DapH/DapD/GlmU-related protein [Thermovenabulum sp.]|uniref:DapH/DapD/GlmU-related protein n=1 Tax=Thermovenabulum sp. TaxID=3100335 RepID=UPI003C7ED5D4